MRKRREGIERADQISWALLIFAAIRTVAWVMMMLFVGLGLLGVRAFDWASHLGNLIVFVTLISFYANAATDLGTVTAAWSAIRAGRAEAQGVDNERQSAHEHRATLDRIETVAEMIYEEQLRR